MVTSKKTRDTRMKKAMPNPVEDLQPRPTVVPYREEFKAEFERLNREWIEGYFSLEPADRQILGDPQGTILAGGGQVFFVLEQGKVQGTCAVLRHSADECEIAKMAVTPEARGRGFGDLLMEACIGFAVLVGARRIVIVSNTVLETAIRLYRKHGFVQVPLARDDRYQRANIRLELELDPSVLGGHRGAAAQ